MDGILHVIKSGLITRRRGPSTDPNIEPGRNLELNPGRAGSDLTLVANQANQTGPDDPIETAALLIIRQTEPLRKRDGETKPKMILDFSNCGMAGGRITFHVKERIDPHSLRLMIPP
jgi:hypothetical protein